MLSGLNEAHSCAYPEIQTWSGLIHVIRCILERTAQLPAAPLSRFGSATHFVTTRMMLASRSTLTGSKACSCRNPAARAAAVGSTPLARAPTANHGALRDAEHIEAQAAFSASLEKVIGAHKGELLPEAPLSMQPGVVDVFDCCCKHPAYIQASLCTA